MGASCRVQTGDSKLDSGIEVPRGWWTEKPLRHQIGQIVSERELQVGDVIAICNTCHLGTILLRVTYMPPFEDPPKTRGICKGLAIRFVNNVAGFRSEALEFSLSEVAMRPEPTRDGLWFAYGYARRLTQDELELWNRLSKLVGV